MISIGFATRISHDIYPKRHFERAGWFFQNNHRRVWQSAWCVQRLILEALRGLQYYYGADCRGRDDDCFFHIPCMSLP